MGWVDRDGEVNGEEGCVYREVDVEEEEVEVEVEV